MDDDAGRPAPSHGHLEGSGHELGVLVGRHGPADHLAGEDIEHGGQEQEAGPGGHVGDVSDPPLVGSRGCEVPVQEIGGRSGPVVSPGGPTELPPGHSLELGLSHETSHPVSPHLFSLFVDQLGGDPAIPIGAPRVLVDIGDLLGEDLVVHGPLGRWTIPPSVVAAPGHVEERAHGGHRQAGPIRLAELERP